MKRNRSKDLKMIDNRLTFSFHTTVGRTYNETQAASAEIQQDTSAHRARKKGKQSAHSPTFSAQFSTASCLVVFTYVSLYLHATVYDVACIVTMRMLLLQIRSMIGLQRIISPSI